MRAIVLLLLETIRAWTPRPTRRGCTALRAHPAFKQKKDPKYSLEAAVEAADRAEEIARDLEYEIVSSAPDGEQLADDYEELGGGRCAVM